ncbi:MAG TPA: hypothetical protein VM716_04230 [Gemmatimonadales bacterium]|nr:hypothetical protein [Gemmatimonadales bacterium]
MSVEAGRITFVVTAIVVVGWFALGTQFNIRRGNRLLRWLQSGMPRLGERTTLRWLGSSGLELKVRDARAPLKSAELFLLLEPRDLPILWWLFRARGRRDLLIIRGELRAPPTMELEVVDARAWSTRGLARSLPQGGWTPIAVSSGSPLVAYGRGRGDAPDAATQLLAELSLPELTLVRVALHSRAPHLELQWHLTGLRDLEARRVFETLHRMAERL